MECQIIFLGKSKEGHTQGCLKMPWVAAFHPTHSDYLLCTHHNMSPIHYPSGSKIFFDTHGIYYRFIEEDWFPTFDPTQGIVQEFSKLRLPKRYTVIHHSWCCEKQRNRYATFPEFVKAYEWILKAEDVVISTGTPFPGCRNLQDLSAWTKQYVMLKADKVYGSHSGFTGMASMYRRRKNTFLIDYDSKANLKPPPIAAYSNVNVKNCNVRAMLYALETGVIGSEDYFTECRKRAGRPLVGIGKLVPDFDYVPDLKVPDDYRPGILLGKDPTLTQEVPDDIVHWFRSAFK